MFENIPIDKDKRLENYSKVLVIYALVGQTSIGSETDLRRAVDRSPKPKPKHRYSEVSK